MGVLRALRHLVHGDGVSVREAARRLCISRNTATRWLSEPEGVVPRYPQRAASAGLLDAYTNHLELWLTAGCRCEDGDRCSVKAYVEWLRAMGFPGSKTLVYNYCRSWKLHHDPAPRHDGFGPLRVERRSATLAFTWGDEGLTARECEVLTWIGRGVSCQGVAVLMGIACLTVRKHRSNILGKLGLHSTAQLVAFAINTVRPPSEVQERLTVSLLSARERQVVAYLVKGLTSKEIARCLNISPATVRKHRENAMKSIRVHGMASLMWHAVGLADT